MLYYMKHIPVFINARDRVTCLSQLVTWLENAGHERIVIVDNDSTYEPLLDYYKNCPHQVVKLGANLGHLAVWRAGLIEQIGYNGSYVVTDPDVVPDEMCPYDAVERFYELLQRYGVDKAGFGLRVDNLPDSYKFKQSVIKWESQFWENQLDEGVYHADTDTTFALYRPGAPVGTYSAVRTGFPYVAQHTTWYQDSENLSPEDVYYRDHATAISTWTGTEIQQAYK